MFLSLMNSDISIAFVQEFQQSLIKIVTGSIRSSNTSGAVSFLTQAEPFPSLSWSGCRQSR
jgi:hypothetical protein